MENAADALYMGFAILAFVVALSLSIFSFSEVTSASQRIIDARDKTTLYDYYTPNGTSRTVKREDIIPTLYRVFDEDYIIVFNFKDKGSLYTIKSEDGTGEIESNIVRNNVGNRDQTIGFIDSLLDSPGAFNNFIKDNGLDNKYIKSSLQSDGLYDILDGKTFKEDIGIYYMEDNASQGESVIDNVNKTKKRIITYTEI